MVNCPKCGAAVREEKAFCHNCGAPMDAVMRERETPMPDFSKTVIEPPRRVAPQQPYVPPAAVTEVQTAGRETTHIQPPGAQSVALPSPMPAPLSGKRKSSRKIGFAFVILLLFLMFVVFVLALMLD
jgi:G:T/U-mismatch repair DNA glycosylase